MNFGIVIPKVSMNFGIRLFFLINLKSATKPFNVLLACTHPLITEESSSYIKINMTTYLTCVLCKSFSLPVALDLILVLLLVGLDLTRKSSKVGLDLLGFSSDFGLDLKILCIFVIDL